MATKTTSKSTAPKASARKAAKSAPAAKSSIRSRRCGQTRRQECQGSDGRSCCTGQGSRKGHAGSDSTAQSCTCYEVGVRSDHCQEGRLPHPNRQRLTRACAKPVMESVSLIEEHVPETETRSF